MPKPKTSKSHPLQIQSVPTPGGGLIGMTFCPGKKQASAVSGTWDRDLDLDLDVIRDWGAAAVVTLMTSQELAHYRVFGMDEGISQRHMGWWHLPISDASVPTDVFEAKWKYAGAVLRSHLNAGERILLHSRGGLGRTGMIAARLLVEVGIPAREAVQRVRNARPGTIENRNQEMHVYAVTQLSVSAEAEQTNPLDWNQSELVQLFVAPFYLSLLHANFLSGENSDDRFAPHLMLASKTISDVQLKCLLDNQNWRTRLAAGWMVGLGRRASLTDRIVELLSTGDGGYSDQGYSVALGLLGGARSRDALVKYLRMTLSSRSTWPHPQWAAGALAHIDRGAAREFMGPCLWSHLQGYGMSAEEGVLQFANVVDYATRNRIIPGA